MGRLRRSASKCSKWLEKQGSESSFALAFKTNSEPGSMASPRSRNLYMENVNARERLIADYQMLVYSFPEFPEAMLKALVIREQGNMKMVAIYLLERGWGKPSPLLDVISNTENTHFTVHYFWGELTPSHIDKLKKQPAGSYFTALTLPKTYALYRINGQGEVQTEYLESPDIVGVPLDMTKLTNPLTRPRSIPPSKLVSFLSCESD